MPPAFELDSDRAARLNLHAPPYGFRVQRTLARNRGVMRRVWRFSGRLLDDSRSDEHATPTGLL